jgi:ubiquinone/menaquinone biosynthesis C-methylase UbiE
MNTGIANAYWSQNWGARLYRRYASKKYEKMHRYVAERINKSGTKRIIDIACGPGDFLVRLHTMNPALELQGTDIASGMVRYASARLPGVLIKEASAEKQPFPDSAFDAATTMMAFHHFPEPIRSLQEVKRILSHGGTYYVADVVASSESKKKLYNILERMVGVRGFLSHYTAEDMEMRAKQAGFQFSIEHIPGMARRYYLMTFTKI